MDSAGSVVAQGREHPLRHRLTIGRDAENDIVLSGRTVSRQHAVLSFANGRWLIEDRGSVNGTFVNRVRVPFGVPHPLRHGDRIAIGEEPLSFSWPAQREDPDRTEEQEALPMPAAPLSPFQLQIVGALCGAWMGDETVDSLPTNEQIAASLGLPGAAGAVKAALRRIYLKAGLTDLPPAEKRRALCRVARASSWL